MASPMGPPLPAGYSLRVQLFGPTAYDATDKPLRCFRVVASPDYTVEEFCVEASRIHEINYGQPLTLKKVQDDQQFDITQSEIIGSLFATASTIRFVQASAIPGREDSVAPNSALRFDPSTSRKREREGGSRVNGSASVNSWKPNKRQRVADPDEPLPSRETEENAGQISRTNGRISDANVIPNSQESIILGNTNGHSLNSRHNEPDEDSNLPSLRGNSSPLGEATARAQSHGSNSRAKSYHIQRATDRGTSVSTAATSPISLDQGSVQNGTNTASQRRTPSTRPAYRHGNGKPSESHDEKSIYEDIAPDDEEFGLAALAKQRKKSLSARNSPGFLGMEWAKSKVNTPPSGGRRSAPREQTTPGELPLTPNSKGREEQKKQKAQAEESRKTRLAAAEARQAEENRKAEAERAKREEQERIEVEDFQRGEAQRQAAVARATRAQKEREAKEKQEAEEERRREEARVAKEQADEEKRVEEERLAVEKAAADEAEKLRREEEEAAATLRRKRKTPTPEASRHSKSSSPAITKARGGTPGSSTTSFIPGQRKSALKRTSSSQAMRSSSPAGSKASTDDSMSGNGIELQMSAPKVHGRRVSFRDEHEQTITPIRPPTRILPPKFGTPKTTPNASTPNSSASVATPNSTTPKPSTSAPKSAIAPSSTPRSSQILPPARTFTPILPPGRSTARSSLGRSITPVQSKESPAPKESTPDAMRKPSPVTAPPARKSITPVLRNSVTPVPMPKEKSKLVEPEEKEPSEDEVSEDDSEEYQPTKSIPEEQPKLARKSDSETDSSGDDDEEEADAKMEIDEDETQSHNSSLRDSRSPVVFSQHPRSTDPIRARRSARHESDRSSESEGDDDDNQDQVEKGSDVDEDSRSTPRNKFLDDEADEGSSNSGSDDEEEAEDEEDEEDKAERNDEDDEEAEIPNSSPPVLPPHKHQASPKPTGINSSKDSISDEGHNTQDEIDQQLTSSLYEAHSTVPESSALVYPPTSSAAPRPSMKIGVSLSSLNRNRSMLATSSAIKPVVSRSGQRTLQAMDEEDTEESEEESDDNSSDSSDAETTKPAQNSKAPPRQDDSDSDSSNSDSDDEVEDEQKKIRDELALEIAGLNASDNANLLSPKLYKTSTQQQDKVKEPKKKAEKKSDKYLNGYKFNTSF